mmetsp:Transcript_1443/g.6320  ORF Transcript_1443/g.6320 Transcript_1443/m.6320 type:complete len:209 (+) Transcript_1443:103-729(+)
MIRPSATKKAFLLVRPSIMCITKGPLQCRTSSIFGCRCSKRATSSLGHRGGVLPSRSSCKTVSWRVHNRRFARSTPAAMPAPESKPNAISSSSQLSPSDSVSSASPFSSSENLPASWFIAWKAGLSVLAGIPPVSWSQMVARWPAIAESSHDSPGFGMGESDVGPLQWGTPARPLSHFAVRSSAKLKPSPKPAATTRSKATVAASSVA